MCTGLYNDIKYVGAEDFRFTLKMNLTMKPYLKRPMIAEM